MKCNILFICTGNIFRSMSAEYLLKDYLKKKGDKRFSVSSAGTHAHKQKMNTFVKQALCVSEHLESYSIPTKHKQRRVTKKMLDEADMVICMAKNHHDFLKKTFDYDAYYFRELVDGSKRSIKDACEQTKDHAKYIPQIIDYIHQSMPKIYEQITYRNFLFEDFVTGKRKKHYNNILFKRIAENAHSLAFLSIDIPRGKHSHALVIPKKRYRHFDDIPPTTLKAMMQLAQTIGKAFKQEYPAYNLLLNDGREAGQFINHAHLHIVPRAADDNIEIEIWHHNHVTQKRYFEQVKHLKKLLAKSK